ncbi:hypothetical protein CapIbe_006901 [Capra ibex]
MKVGLATWPSAQGAPGNSRKVLGHPTAQPPPRRKRYMEKEIRNKSSNMEEEKQSLAVMGLVAVDAHLTAGFLARWFQSQGLRWGLSSLRPPPLSVKCIMRHLRF